MTINSHGLKPTKVWKFFEREGWQMLVHWEFSDDENEDSNEQTAEVVFEVPIEEIGATASVKLKNLTPQQAQELFENYNDDPEVDQPTISIQAVLDQVAPMIAEMQDLNFPVDQED